MSEYIVDVNLENAQQVLIEESQTRPVVIDFWSDSSEPCRDLMPILERLANEYDGQFLLAKVNAEEMQQIASQFGVRSLPTVMVMQNGQPVDGFQGAQSEAQVREFLAKFLPKPWDAWVQQANEFIEQQQWSEALPLLRQAYEASAQDLAIAKQLVRVNLELNRCDDARELLASFKMADQDGDYHQLLSLLDLKVNAAKAPEIQALEQQLVEQPGDLSLMYQLALQYSQNEHQADALDMLLQVLRKDISFNEGQAKKATLDIIAALGKGDPLGIKYQRQVFSLLY